MEFPEEIAAETASSWAGQSENKGNWRKLMSTAPLVDPVGTTCKCCGQKAGDCVPWVQYEPVFDEGDALVGKKPRAVCAGFASPHTKQQVGMLCTGLSTII